MDGRRTGKTPVDSVGQPSPVVHAHIIFKILTILASDLLSDEEVVGHITAFIAEMESQQYSVSVDLDCATLQPARDCARCCISYCSLQSSTGEGLLRHHILPLIKSLPKFAARWPRSIQKSENAFFVVARDVIDAMNGNGQAIRAAMASYINLCAKPVFSIFNCVGLEAVAQVAPYRKVAQGVVIASASLEGYECFFPPTADRVSVAGHTLGLAGFVNAVCKKCKPNACLTFHKTDYVCKSWHSFSLTTLRKISIGEALVVKYESDSGDGDDESSFDSCNMCLSVPE